MANQTAQATFAAPPFGKGLPPTNPDPMQGFVPPPQVLFETARRLGAHPAYHVRSASAWQGTSWQDYGESVRQAARALLQLGVQRGDAVAILGFNSPQWATMAFAAMAIGATPAGIYWTSSSQDIDYILNHCEDEVDEAYAAENESEGEDGDEAQTQAEIVTP